VGCLLEQYQPIVEVGLCNWPMLAAPAQIAQMLLLGAGFMSILPKQHIISKINLQVAHLLLIFAS
jgi:hypothetical protein